MKTEQELRSEMAIDDGGKGGTFRVWWLNRDGFTVEQDGFRTREEAEAWADERAYQNAALES